MRERNTLERKKIHASLDLWFINLRALLYLGNSQVLSRYWFQKAWVRSWEKPTGSLGHNHQNGSNQDKTSLKDKGLITTELGLRRQVCNFYFSITEHRGKWHRKRVSLYHPTSAILGWGEQTTHAEIPGQYWYLFQELENKAVTLWGRSKHKFYFFAS